VTPCVLGVRYEGKVSSIEYSEGWSPRGVETDILPEASGVRRPRLDAAADDYEK
jgi:hypothetical protein